MPNRSPINGEQTELLFITWAENCSRSDSIAKRLQGRSVMIYSPHWGSNYFTIVFKYLSQSIKTLRTLFKYKPRVVLVMTPPVFACTAVWLYAKITGCQYAIDAHSGAFVDQRWQWTLPIHGFFSRHAVVTLVTNDYLGNLVRTRGARTQIVRDVPVCFAEPVEVKLKGRLNMTFISTFTRDEPLEPFLQAAARLPEIEFYVTGRLKDANPEVLKGAPPNVTFTDFLKDSEYVGLLLASDAVICLTTADHTMQRGAYEAVYLRKPVITSNFGILREAFPVGTVFVRDTADDIAKGINEMKNGLSRYRQEVEQLHDSKLEQWKRVSQELRFLFGTTPQTPVVPPATQES